MTSAIYSNNEIPMCPHCENPIGYPEDLAHTWVSDVIGAWHNDECWDCNEPFSVKRISTDEVEIVQGAR